MNPANLDRIIHERVRLAVMSALAARGELAFNELKELLSVTDGNLSVHADVLVRAGLVAVRREFVGKKPRTTFVLTTEGKTRFKEYVKELEEMVRQSKEKGG